jgi:hypothetical protein
MRWLDISIDLILSNRIMVLGVDLASNRNEYQESSLEAKGGRRVRPITSSSSVSRLFRENVGASMSQPYGPPQPVTGMCDVWRRPSQKFRDLQHLHATRQPGNCKWHSTDCRLCFLGSRHFCANNTMRIARLPITEHGHESVRVASLVC